MIQIFKKISNSQIEKQAIKKVQKKYEQSALFKFTSDQSTVLQRQLNQSPCPHLLKNKLQILLDQRIKKVAAYNNKEPQPASASPVRVYRYEQFLEKETPLDPAYWSLNCNKTKQTKTFLKNIKQKQIARKTKLQERNNEIKKRQQKNFQQQSQKQQQQRIKSRQLQKQHILNKIDQIKSSSLERQRQITQFRQFIKNYREKQPLHLKMEKQFQQNQKKIQAQRLSQLKTIPQHQYKPPKQRSAIPAIPLKVYKSRFYRQLQRDNSNQKLPSLVQRQKAYSLIVKQNFTPSIACSEQAQSQQQSVLEIQQVPYHSRIQQLGKQYIQYMRRLKKKEKTKQDNSQKELEQEPKPKSTTTRKIIKKNMGLAQLDELNKKDLSDQQKQLRLHQISHKIDEQVRREEQDLRLGVYKGSFFQKLNKRETIDSKYLVSIRAKLKILQS